jgi:hypothetical protein
MSGNIPLKPMGHGDLLTSRGSFEENARVGNHLREAAARDYATRDEQELARFGKRQQLRVGSSAVLCDFDTAADV